MRIPHLFGSPQHPLDDDSPEARPNRRWRRVLPITAGALALMLGGASAAYASAHKTVTLDVDGQRSTVTTFSGSVDGVLADEHVSVGARDVVTPAGALRDGTQIVVRHAHLLTVERDGEQQSVWSTAASAGEALTSLATVVAPRPSLVVSHADGRATLPLSLTGSGPLDVVADGRVRTLPDGATDVAAALASAGVTLRPLDTVSVTRADSGRLEVVVQRVTVRTVTTTVAVPFTTRTVPDAKAYRGTSTVRQHGVAGAWTTTGQVTTVNGVETARAAVSNAMTAAPIDQIVAVGTKARPVAPKPVAKPAAKPAPQPAAKAAPKRASSSAAKPAPRAPGAVASLNWAALARCESGGRTNAVSRNGKYYGLYQFALGTWRAVGGSGLPSQASAAEQTARAQALYARSGAGQWPVCGKNLFR